MAIVWQRGHRRLRRRRGGGGGGGVAVWQSCGGPVCVEPRR